MKIKLEKNFVIEIFCCFQEGARSLHRLLDPGNPFFSFKKYYHAEKIACVKQIRNRILQIIPPDFQAGEVTIDQIMANLPEPGVFQVFFGFCFGKRKKYWSFHILELVYFQQNLERLIAIIEGHEKPKASPLISQRMKLSWCQGIIKNRCLGLPELKPAQKVDHFDKTPWLPTVTVAEILKKSA